jgi:hypothetical protein
VSLDPLLELSEDELAEDAPVNIEQVPVAKNSSVLHDTLLREPISFSPAILPGIVGGMSMLAISPSSIVPQVELLARMEDPPVEEAPTAAAVDNEGFSCGDQSIGVERFTCISDVQSAMAEVPAMVGSLLVPVVPALMKSPHVHMVPEESPEVHEVQKVIGSPLVPVVPALMVSPRVHVVPAVEDHVVETVVGSPLVPVVPALVMFPRVAVIQTADIISDDPVLQAIAGSSRVPADYALMVSQRIPMEVVEEPLLVPVVQAVLGSPRPCRVDEGSADGPRPMVYQAWPPRAMVDRAAEPEVASIEPKDRRDDLNIQAAKRHKPSSSPRMRIGSVLRKNPLCFSLKFF